METRFKHKAINGDKIFYLQYYKGAYRVRDGIVRGVSFHFKNSQGKPTGKFVLYWLYNAKGQHLKTNYDEGYVFTIDDLDGAEKEAKRLNK